ncbi:MAG: hypothetical protein EHM27_14370 [Deltaproteobacteria bacterium]|nr:MAG: hypothetical protein EHM27_14370 [Deltaproteobacteria bacterium]
MAYIRVAYKTKDIDFDYVPGNRLDTLIAQDEISHFFRPAEKRWVSIKFDTVRGEGGDEYQGPERRRNDNPLRPAGKEAENYPSSEEASGKDWLEGLWRQIETS